MEGSKNPSPLSWAWFGAVRIERKPLRYEQDFRRLLHHTHPRRRPLSYFLNPAPDKEDEPDEEEDRTEADTPAGERSSQPSTPQTPADGKGTSYPAVLRYKAKRYTRPNLFVNLIFLSFSVIFENIALTAI